ncbi:MAG TPA: 16S rRNA (adenine(1518)-N(6)/adenine(1519)-N(6))-dimethyltransferase [Parvularcula sp.]|nr:16S rRNA (adenine(1518)-N(6)/adenine(1519)-N(6))-dimethyltransferase [Parvularcula sp.]HBS31077.1 16S rRNA (adenine(1518)-N(6)/adenine(1519)-N(6))-dimethyltransferase [Parvularcula sp.]HBS33455.1 16S rRNA (adenine(1518)-N(6)/adenine(1519)-N(6))-dimethyltransferase [Parvularcula sp.]
MSDALPPLREVIARHDLGADKSFGQHFLLDLNITRKIARAAGAASGDRIIEVGPGPGGLTRALLESGAAVIAVERDRRFLDALEELRSAHPGALTIIEADALKADERALAPAPVKIVSNLPYNISTGLLVKWLVANHQDEAPLWTQMTLMFQKEVADRILARPGSKTYGRLSVIAQAASRPRRAFDLPARAFTPPPRVDSSVVTFEPATDRLADVGALEQLTQAAFSQRRKMLRSSLKPLWGAGVEARLAAADVAPTKRAEELTVAEFLKLSE